MPDIPADQEAPALSELLSDEALERVGLNVTQLARKLLSGRATDRQINSKRRLIQKWKAGEVRPGPASARALARILGGTASDYRKERPRVADWRAEIETRLHEIERLLGAIAQMLDLQPPRRRGGTR